MVYRQGVLGSVLFTNLLVEGDVYALGAVALNDPENPTIAKKLDEGFTIVY